MSRFFRFFDPVLRGYFVAAQAFILAGFTAFRVGFRLSQCVVKGCDTGIYGNLAEFGLLQLEMGQCLAFEGGGRVESVAGGEVAAADEGERTGPAEEGEQDLRLTEAELARQGRELAHEIDAVGGKVFGQAEVHLHEGVVLEWGGFDAFPPFHFLP